MLYFQNYQRILKITQNGVHTGKNWKCLQARNLCGLGLHSSSSSTRSLGHLPPAPCAAPARAPWPLRDLSLPDLANINSMVPQAPAQAPRCPRDARRRSLTSASRHLLDVRFTSRSGREPRVPSRSVCGASSSARVPQARASPQKSQQRRRTDAAPAAGIVDCEPPPRGARGPGVGGGARWGRASHLAPSFAYARAGARGRSLRRARELMNYSRSVSSRPAQEGLVDYSQAPKASFSQKRRLSPSHWKASTG